MKGQQQVLSAIMLTGIMITVVGSVYFWGIPLVQKNQDINSLQNAESFMLMLNERIKFVANNAGRDQVMINVPGILTFDAEMQTLGFEIQTGGTIYAAGGGLIPLSKTKVGVCNSKSEGIWGTDVPEVLCVKSIELGENSYKTTYNLGYRELTKTAKSYKIKLAGESSSGGQDHTVVIDYMGADDAGSLINTNVKITIL
ncbi:MAG: hypothetical protein ABIG30_00515 [Candidatus Aenigmatarchaeota archaeon]